MKDTLEKWEVDLSDTNGHGGWTVKAGIHIIATVYANIVKAPRKNGDMAKLEANQESIANARLIASSPELLEACKQVHNLISYPVMGIDLFHKIREILEQAIIKAEGK